MSRGGAEENGTRVRPIFPGFQQQLSLQLFPQLLQLQQPQLQQQLLPQLLPPQEPPQEPPQQQNSRTRMMMIHRQEQSLLPLLKHISDTSL